MELTAIVALAIAVMAPTLHSSKGKPPLPTPLYLLLTISALVYARMVLYDELQLLLGYPPSAGVLTGALIIALAIAQLPLVQQRFAHSQSAKRMVACLAAVGLLLAVLKPPLPDKVSEYCFYSMFFLNMCYQHEDGLYPNLQKIVVSGELGFEQALIISQVNRCCCATYNMGCFMHSLLTRSGVYVGGSLLLAV